MWGVEWKTDSCPAFEKEPEQLAEWLSADHSMEVETWRIVSHLIL